MERLRAKRIFTAALSINATAAYKYACKWPLLIEIWTVNIISNLFAEITGGKESTNSWIWLAATLISHISEAADVCYHAGLYVGVSYTQQFLSIVCRLQTDLVQTRHENSAHLGYNSSIWIER